MNLSFKQNKNPKSFRENKLENGPSKIGGIQPLKNF